MLASSAPETCDCREQNSAGAKRSGCRLSREAGRELPRTLQNDGECGDGRKTPSLGHRGRLRSSATLTRCTARWGPPPETPWRAGVSVITRMATAAPGWAREGRREAEAQQDPLTGWTGNGRAAGWPPSACGDNRGGDHRGS